MRRSAEQWCPGAVLVSAQTRVAPYLLRMKWKGFPLHYHAHLGWGYIVPPEMHPGVVPEWDEDDNVRFVYYKCIKYIKRRRPCDFHCMFHSVGDGGHSELIEEDEGALFGIDLESRDTLQDSLDNSNAEGTSGVYRRANRLIQAEREREDKETQWMAEKINTAFGTTDDVVHLMNGKTYYYFKLPHKVNG